jgi:transcriptional regulator with PAS, ATPase and Fis domain
MNNQFKVDIYRYFRLVKFEYKISLAYLMVGLLWILFSDEALALLISDPVLLTKFQTYKGSFYILVTASLLFFMAKKHVGKLEEQQTLFEIMFNTISDCVIIANTNREMVMVNKSTIETFGYEKTNCWAKPPKCSTKAKTALNHWAKKYSTDNPNRSKSQYLLNYKTARVNCLRNIL